MNAPISNPADCEVRGVIRYLQAENVRPSEIHRRLVAVYGEHVMNAASVRKWCTMFRNGRTDVHDAERSGRPSVITCALKQKVKRIIREIDISQIAKCTNSVRKCFVQLCTKLSPNICNTAKFVNVGSRGGQAAIWYEEGISKLVSRYNKCLSVQGDYVEK